MKKRLISLLLTLVMLVSLCTVFATSASADAQVTAVTLGSGDTVLGICQKYGIDYYTYKDVIMKLNGLTSESQFSKLSVGTQIVIPISNTAAATLSGSKTTATTTTATTTATTTSTTATSTALTTGTTSSLPSGDRVAYYLIAYTVQSGDTISKIYANMGLSYKTYSNQIVKLNGLSSVNSIQVGKTLLLPTTSPSIAGMSYTTVMAHTMASGESAYNIVCSDYGLNYTSAQSMLKALNNRTDLSNFRVGETLYIPVSGVVTATTTVNNTGTTTTTGTVSTSGYYNLVSQTPTNGSFDLQVNGKSVKTATAGQTVSVVCTPDTGYAVDTIKVVKVGDANTSTTVTNNSFVMPAYSAIVSVTFKQSKQYEITIDSAVNGVAIAMVDNTSVTKAYAGTQVTIKTTPANGFMLDYVRVTYNNYVDTVAVEGGKFTMPNFAVTVTPVFKVDPDYKPGSGNRIYTDITNATITAKVGDSAVEYAKKGDRVTLTVTPKENYTLESLVVYTEDFTKTVTMDKMSFTMPDGPVTVVAVVKPTSDATFEINKIDNTEGTFKTLVDNKEVTTAKVGQTVKVEGTSTKAFYNYVIFVTKVGDSSVSVPVADDGTFVMPDFAVNVRVKFYIYHNIVLDSSNGTYGYFNVTAVNTGTVISRCGAGVELQVNIWGLSSGKSANRIVLTYANGSSYTLTDTNKFIMPDCDVRVRVEYADNVTVTAHSAQDKNTDGSYAYLNWGNTYSIMSQTLNDKSGYTKTLYAGKGNLVNVSVDTAIGYEVDSLYYVAKLADGTTEQGTISWNYMSGIYQFQVPKTAKSVDVYAKFAKIASYSVTANPTNANNEYGVIKFMTSLGYTDSVIPNQKVWVRVEAVKADYKFDFSKLRIYRADDTAKVDIKNDLTFDPLDDTFLMPAYDVVVDVSECYTEKDHVIILDNRVDADTQNVKGVLKVSIDDTVYVDTNKDKEVITGSSVLRVEQGKLIVVTHESMSGFYLKSISVTTKDGKAVETTVLSDNSCCFIMPLSDVVITPVYDDDYFTVTAKASEYGTFEVEPQAKLEDGAKITNVKPADGYTVAKTKDGTDNEAIYMSYTDVNGVAHRELVENRVVKPSTMPDGVVTVEVEFAPVSHELKIVYEFGSDKASVSDKNLYKVNILVDGAYKEITRGEGTDADTVKDEIETGKSVIIRENTSGKDDRFEIKSIWVLYNNESISANYVDGDYYFVMPNADKGECEIHVSYGLKSSSKYVVHSDITNGTADVDTASFGTNTEVEITVTPAEGYKCAGTEASIAYKDYDGIEQTDTLTDYVLNEDGTITFTIPAGYFKGAPESTVEFCYYCEAETASAETETEESTSGETSENPAQYTVSGTEGLISFDKTTAAAGETVTATLTEVKGMTVTAVTANGEAATFTDGVCSFTMPEQDVAFVVTSEKSIKASYSVTDEDGTKVTYNESGKVEADGNFAEITCNGEFIENVALVAGDTVTATPEEGYYFISFTVKYTADGKTKTLSTTLANDGKRSFTLPNSFKTGELKITAVQCKNTDVKYPVTVKYENGAEAGSFNITVNGAAYTDQYAQKDKKIVIEAASGVAATDYTVTVTGENPSQTLKAEGTGWTYTATGLTPGAKITITITKNATASSATQALPSPSADTVLSDDAGDGLTIG